MKLNNEFNKPNPRYKKSLRKSVGFYDDLKYILSRLKWNPYNSCIWRSLSGDSKSMVGVILSGHGYQVAKFLSYESRFEPPKEEVEEFSHLRKELIQKIMDYKP